MPASATDSSRKPRIAWAAWLFPIVIWFVATFFFLGDLGKYSDDYCFTKLDPVSGKTASLLFWPGPHFWRPAHIIVTYALQTTLWEHERINHFINAGMHGVVAILLWRLLLRTGCSQRASAAGSLVFLAAPVAYEVPLWPAALSTSIATALFLVLADMYVSWSRKALSPVWLPAMAVIAFLIPCFNEQPATGIAALPLLYAAVAPRDTLRRAIWRAFTPVLICTAVCFAYIYLLVSTAYPGARGGAGSYTSLEQAPEKLAWLMGELRGHFLPSQFWYAAVRQGLDTLVTHRVAGLVVLSAFVGTLYPLTRWWVQGAAQPAREATGTRLWLLAFGAAIFVAAWLPVAAIWTQDAAPRLCYFPMIGIATIIAAGIDLVLVRVRARSHQSATGAVLGLLVLAVATLATASLGLQTAMHRRGQLDRSAGETLRELVPTPRPNTVVLPLALDSRPTTTGEDRFDNKLVSVWETPWSAEAYIRHTYRRSDVFGAHLWRVDRASPVLGMDAEFVRHADVMRPFKADPAGGVRIPWANVLPFVTQLDGSLHLVTHVVVPSGETVEVPQARGQPTLTFHWPPPRPH